MFSKGFKKMRDRARLHAKLPNVETSSPVLYPAPNIMTNVSGSDKVAAAMPKPHKISFSGGHIGRPKGYVPPMNGKPAATAPLAKATRAPVTTGLGRIQTSIRHEAKPHRQGGSPMPGNPLKSLRAHTGAAAMLPYNRPIRRKFGQGTHPRPNQSMSSVGGM